MNVKSKPPVKVSANSDLELERITIERAKVDPQYFAPLYKKYYPSMFSFVFQRVENEDVAHDVTSEIFVKVLTKLHQYQNRGLPFGAWLFRIGYNEVMNQFRRQKNQRIVRVELEELENLSVELGEDVSSFKSDQIIQNLSQLRPQDFNIIELKYFENKSHEEIAQVLDLSTSATKVRLHRAIKSLKKLVHN
ncbi:MAG: RNA polymerase sigma-70 factor (ECF subfamily) [Bacteroidia bacterium]|jgi:RNA polymerase sigma-70 factor (ECF subfamily)